MVLAANTDLGQHWLKDEVILSEIVAAAELEAGQMVLEIGPGLGALTRKLLAAGANVTAIEVDERLIAKLRAEFTGQMVSVVQGDIRQVDLGTYEEHVIVANIPYYLTSFLLRQLSAMERPVPAVLLIQKEVAERVAAADGQQSLLSLAVGRIFMVERLSEVPPTAFDPPPAVYSQVIRLTPLKEPRLKVNERLFWRIAHAGFGEKRKKLRSSLAGGLQVEKPTVDAWLKQAKINPDARAQELQYEEWQRLYDTIAPAL